MAANLDALDLELSQTHKLYEIINNQNGNRPSAARDQVPQRNIGGDMMESLNLETGIKGVMEKREARLA